jgi:IS30 family transposase
MGSRLEYRAREARFWELLTQGHGRTAACDAVGVDRRQGYRWVKAAGGRNPFAHTPRSDRFLGQEERPDRGPAPERSGRARDRESTRQGTVDYQP